MKRIILAIICLCGIMTARPWWAKDFPYGSHSFRGVCAVNDSLVWAVGKNGDVWKRTGGVHSPQWVQITNLPSGYTYYDFNDISFVGENHGWIVGEKKYEPNKYEGVIYWTSDGGASWHLPTYVPPLPLPTPFLKVKMANIQVGYISAGNGIVLQTWDGGASWSRCKSPYDTKDSISVWYQGLWVDPNNPQNLWVSGDAFGIIAKSTNGGASWVAYQPDAFGKETRRGGDRETRRLGNYGGAIPLTILYFTI